MFFWLRKCELCNWSHNFCWILSIAALRATTTSHSVCFTMLCTFPDCLSFEISYHMIFIDPSTERGLVKMPIGILTKKLLNLEPRNNTKQAMFNKKHQYCGIFQNRCLILNNYVLSCLYNSTLP
jgi:hypothetical protein